MFALVQTARGADRPSPASEIRSAGAKFPLVFQPKMHPVMINSVVPVAHWNEAELALLANALQAAIGLFGAGATPVRHRSNAIQVI